MRRWAVGETRELHPTKQDQFVTGWNKMQLENLKLRARIQTLEEALRGRMQIDWNLIREDQLRTMPEALLAVRSARARIQTLEAKIVGLVRCAEEAGAGARVWVHIEEAEREARIQGHLQALAGEKGEVDGG